MQIENACLKSATKVSSLTLSSRYKLVVRRFFSRRLFFQNKIRCAGFPKENIWIYLKTDASEDICFWISETNRQGFDASILTDDTIGLVLNAFLAWAKEIEKGSRILLCCADILNAASIKLAQKVGGIFFGKGFGIWQYMREGCGRRGAFVR